MSKDAGWQVQGIIVAGVKRMGSMQSHCQLDARWENLGEGEGGRWKGVCCLLLSCASLIGRNRRIWGDGYWRIQKGGPGEDLAGSISLGPEATPSNALSITKRPSRSEEKGMRLVYSVTPSHSNHNHRRKWNTTFHPPWTVDLSCLGTTASRLRPAPP